MILPNETDLSREQKEIISAPPEGTILVVGPPGSGKTVVALMRERALKKQRETVRSLVFNNVLTQYTGNELTFHRWISEFWEKTTGKRFPAGRVEVGGGSPQWQQDYAKAGELAAGECRARIRQKGHWGHVVLDEAQDFPPAAHRLLCQMQHKVFVDLADDERPSLCLLADENQRITNSHATLKEIRAAHAFLTPRDEYMLTKNYRNTRPIAQFASHFYVGLQSGIPELPSKEGDKPRVLVADLDQSVDRVKNYMLAHPNEEVGVLVQYTQTRKKIFNKLTHRLKDTKVIVQTYPAKSEEHGDASHLVFDRSGVVTVLCFASAKGLEFDAVFLPELQTLRVEGAERDQVRMNLYVMCSRARRQLWLTIDDDTKTHEIWKFLPAGELYEEERR